MSRSKLSVCMIARDEQLFLPGALQSLIGLPEEVIVCIDDRTTDDTELVARQFGARVRQFSWKESFAEARNVSLSHARHDWILVIDADDRLTPMGHSIIREILRRNVPQIQGYQFQVAERALDGRQLAVEWTSVRMFPNHPGYRYSGRVHEQVLFARKPLDTVARIEGTAIMHVGYDPDIYVVRDKWQRNLTLLRRELMERPDHPYLLFQMARTYMHTNPDLAAAYAEQALSSGVGLFPEQRAEMEALTRTNAPAEMH